MQQDHNEKIKEIQAKNKKVLIDFMAANGIEAISMKFDGYGDSGQIQSVYVTPPDKQELLHGDVPRVTYRHIYQDGEWKITENESVSPVTEHAQDLAYSVLGNMYGGWDINEGSHGFVVIKADGTGQVQYHQRIIESEYSEVDF